MVKYKNKKTKIRDIENTKIINRKRKGKILNTILKILLTILITTIIAITIVILYFFIFDIETKIPKEIEQECKIETKQFMGRKIFILKDKENISSEKYILYFHGGSYVAEATQNHFNFLERLVKDTKYTIIMPDYPLTPKYTYDDVFDMTVPLYKEIISKVNNNDLILMGDSAGGGLALGLYEKIATDFIDIPSKTILISPWLDVKLQNNNINEVSKNDDILSKEKLILAGLAYAGKDGMDKYLVNPINGELSKLNNVVIFTGTYDILNPDAMLLKEKADKLGGNVNLKVYDKAKHIWLIDNNSESEITNKAYNDLLKELRNEGE